MICIANHLSTRVYTCNPKGLQVYTPHAGDPKGSPACARAHACLGVALWGPHLGTGGWGHLAQLETPLALRAAARRPPTRTRARAYWMGKWARTLTTKKSPCALLGTCFLLLMTGGNHYLGPQIALFHLKSRAAACDLRDLGLIGR